MTSYIIRRLIQTVIVIFLVTFISFSLLVIIPGDPAAIDHPPVITPMDSVPWAVEW